MYPKDYVLSFSECLAYTAGGNAITAVPISKLLRAADDGVRNIPKIGNLISDAAQGINKFDTVISDLADTTKNIDNTKIVADIRPKIDDVCTGQGCGTFDNNGNPLCFVAGTKVHTKDGLKNIEEIKIGDLVLARNEITGEVEYRSVLLTPVSNTENIVDVVTKNETISATPNHRFWVQNRGWVDAKDLQIGDDFISSEGAVISVVSINFRHDPQTVYNLTVDEFHTYFVGEQGIWVHNQYSPTNPGPTSAAEILQDVKRFIIESETSTLRTGYTGHAQQKHSGVQAESLLSRLESLGNEKKVSSFRDLDEMSKALEEFVTNNATLIDNWYMSAPINSRFRNQSINYTTTQNVGYGYELDSVGQFSMLFPDNKVLFRIEKTANGMVLVTGFPDI